MEPKRLFLENGQAVKPHICGKCGRIWESVESAERCCKCGYCGEYCDWRKGVSHDACQREALRKGEAAQLEKAELIHDYNGPFLWGDHTVYMDADELLESVEPDELPEFGFCTKYEPPRIDIGRILESAGDEMHEDWEPNDTPELAPAIEAWNEANKSNGTYYEDRKRKWSKAGLLALAALESPEQTKA